jgi:hypothetical protein
MTVAEWIATRAPAPPAPLVGRVLVALGESGDDDAAFAPERCLDAAERVVGGLLREGRTGRESAGDLLAADALVTYAFEAASEDPARLGDRARAAMRRLANLGAIDGGSPARR